MFSLEQYLGAIRHEVKVIRHLHSKVPADRLDYRPTPGQRSLRELLDFIPCNLAFLPLLLHGSWNQAGDLIPKTQAAAATDFTGTLDRELNAFVETLQSLPESAFLERDAFLPTGDVWKLGDALLNLPLKFLTGYKMQLFLYLKSCGLAELNTFNCWLGMDGSMPGATPPKEQAS